MTSMMIDELIQELQKIRDRWGNTTVTFNGITWGANALWEEVYDEQPHRRPVTDYSHLAECE